MHDDKDPIVPLDLISRPRTSRDVPIEVSTYSGYKADERPVSFVLEGRRIGLLEILYAWIEEDSSGTVRRYCYEVVTDDHEKRVLVFNATDARWFIRLEKEVITAT
jgi:hypothetical protein